MLDGKDQSPSPHHGETRRTSSHIARGWTETSSLAMTTTEITAITEQKVGKRAAADTVTVS